MYTVNNKIFQNFDHLLDINALLKLKPFLSAYIARNSEYCRPTKFGRMSFYGEETKLTGVHDAVEYYKAHVESLDDDLKPIIQELIANDLLGSFVIYEDDVTHTSLSFNTRYNTHGLYNKHKPECVARVPVDYQMQFFYNWLDAQHIFKEYGRVLFFISHPGSKQIAHTDPSDPEKNNPDEFIWINLNPKRKKFYVLNPITQEKTYVNGYVNWFNTDNFHGGDAVEYSCYALRIDGTFSDEFKEKFMGK
jgi:hypothetical protein